MRNRAPEDLVARARGAVALRVFPHRRGAGVGRAVLGARTVEGEHEPEADRLVGADAHHHEPLRLAREPVLEERRRLAALVGLGHLEEGAMVPRP